LGPAAPPLTENAEAAAEAVPGAAAESTPAGSAPFVADARLFASGAAAAVDGVGVSALSVLTPL
jgi:hypothetical protein